MINTLNYFNSSNKSFSKFLFPFTLFLFYFFISIHIPSKIMGQCPPAFPGQQDLRDVLDPGCPANDVQIESVFIDLGAGCITCEPGEIITTSLLINAFNNSNSDRYLSVISTVEYTLPDGTITTCDILVCDGPLPGQVTSTIDAGEITFECGTMLELTDILTIYDTPSGSCPVNNPPNGKYCFLSENITVDALLTATITAECVAGANALNVDLTVSGGDGNYSYLWNNGDTSEDLLNVPLGSYTVTVTDGVGCTAEATNDFQGPCCSFDVTCPMGSQSGTYDCDNPVPDPIFDITMLENEYGIIINDNCGEVNVEYTDNEPNYCMDGTFTRVITITDDGTPDVSFSCDLIYDITTIPLEIDCPGDLNVMACTQDEVNMAFQDWIDLFGFTGGCNAIGSIQSTDQTSPLNPPNLCSGESVGAFYLALDDCNPNGISCTFEFSVTVEPLIINCPNDITISGCQNQDDIDLAFNNWLGEFTFSGGCDPSDNIQNADGTNPLNVPSLCGGTVTALYQAFDNCNPDGLSCFIDFTVEPEPLSIQCENSTMDNAFVINCLDDILPNSGGYLVEGDCQSLNTTIDIQGPFLSSGQDECNGSIYIMSYTVTDACLRSDQCDQYFIIEQLPPVIACAPNRTFDCYNDYLAYVEPSVGDINFDLNDVLTNSSADCELGLQVEILSIDDQADPCTGGDIFITYQVLDECGQAAQCVQTVTVLADNIGPTSDPIPDENVAQCEEIPSPDVGVVSNVMDNCGGGVNIDWLEDSPENPSCDETLIIRTYVISDLCGNQTMVFQNINLTPPDDVVVTCPDDLVVSACDFTTAQDLSDAFDMWLLDFSVTGQGCGTTDPVLNIDGAPSLCSNQDVIITVSYSTTDGCTFSDCVRTFTILAYEPIDLMCPESVSFSSCDFTDGNDLDVAFQSWIDQFSVSGGCSVSLPDLSVYTAPSICGDSETVIDISLEDFCESTNCTVSFAIESSDPVSLMCPESIDVSGCIFDTQEDLDIFFFDWLDQLTITNEGCGVVPLDVSQYQPPLLCELQGQVVDVVVSITDGCTSAECFTAFELTPREVPVVSCPDDVTYSTCQFTDEQHLEDIYNDWVAQFVIIEDGCLTISDFRFNIPAFCSLENQVLTVDFGQSDICFIVACSATFTLLAEELVEVSCPASVNYDACDIPDQNELESLYAEWISQFVTLNEGCGVTMPDLSLFPTPELCPASEAIEINIDYEIADNCSSDACSASFSVSPTPELTLECPETLVLECGVYTEQDVQDWLNQVNTYSSCANLTVVNDYVPGSLEEPCNNSSDPFELTINFTATDQCQTINCSTVIRVEDNIPPEIICPESLTLEFGDPLNESLIQDWLNSVSGSDLCSEVTLSNTFDESDLELDCDIDGENNNNGNNNPARSQSVVFTVVDQCGLTTTCSSNLYIVDTTDPEISCPEDITINCEESTDPETNLDIRNWLNSITASDFGGGPVSIVNDYDPVNFIDQDCPSNQFQVVTFTATDQCDNESSCTSTIFRRDVFPPVITQSPMDMDVPCSNAATHEEQYQEWLSNVGGAMAEDACTDVVWSTELVTDFILCGNTFQRTVLFIASDLCGNMKSEQAVFSVIDDEAPFWTTAPGALDMTFQCVNPNFVPVPPEFMDDCNPETVTLTVVSDETIPGECPILEVRKVVWEATDICMNTSVQYMAIYTFIDDEPPVIDVSGYPGLEDVENGGTVNLQCVTNNEEYLLPNFSSLPGLAIDACSDVDIEIFEDVIGEGDCTEDGYFVQYYCRIVATDECDNSSSFEFYISIVDDIAPTFDSLPESYIYADCNRIPPPDSLSANDACICAYIDFNEVYNDQGTLCQDDDIITRTWVATDHCANSTTFVQTIDVVDDTGPRLIDDFFGSDDFNCYDKVPEIDVSYFKDCSGVTLISIDELITDTHCSNLDMLSRTYNLVDECGNYSSEQIDTYIYSDDFTDLAPYFAGNLTEGTPVNSEVTWSADYYYGEYVISSADLVWNADCGSDYFITFTSITEDVECNDDGITQIIHLEWLLSDICRNEQVYFLTINIEGSAGIIIPSDLTIGCEEELPSIGEIDSTFQVTITESVVEGNCESEFTVMRDIEVIDDCGQVNSYQQTIQVEETPPDIQMDSVVCYEIVEETRTAIDVCNGNVLNIYKINTDTILSCDNFLRLQYTWETDPTACGNTYVFEQLAILEDNTAPNFDNGSNPLIEAIWNGNLGIVYTSQTEIIQFIKALIAEDNYVQAFDQCGEFIEVEKNHSYEVFYCTHEVYGSLYALVSLEWYAEDQCGNFNLMRQSIAIYDDTAPIVTAPADITISNCQNLPPVVDAIVSDENEFTVSFSETTDNSDPLSFIITRTWTATDACGNSSSDTQIIQSIPTSLDCSISISDEIFCNTSGNTAYSQVFGTGPYTYHWSISGLGCQITSDVNAYAVSYTVGFTDATLTLEVTDAFGCTTECTRTITCTEIPKDEESEEDEGEEEDIDEGENNIDSGDNDQLRLNGWDGNLRNSIAFDDVYVDILESEKLDKKLVFNYYIVDSQGRYNAKNLKLQRLTSNRIDVSRLSPGVYLLVILDSRGLREIIKFIKV